MAPAGQVTSHEQMAQVIEVADGLVDRPVLDHGLVGQTPVEVENGLDTVPEILLDISHDHAQP